MGEDPEAPNYDPVHKIIRSMQNGSRGPMLRKATALDWVGDPFEVKGFDAAHGESTFDQFLAHYEEYGDVVGDHFLNLVATTLPMNAPIGGPLLTVQLDPGCGQTLVLEMTRYANQPTVLHPWQRAAR